MPILNESDPHAAWAHQFTSVMGAMHNGAKAPNSSRGWGDESHPGWPMVSMNSVITVYVIAVVLACAAVVSLGLGLILVAAGMYRWIMGGLAVRVCFLRANWSVMARIGIVPPRFRPYALLSR